jgi:hypothetical protein
MRWRLDHLPGRETLWFPATTTSALFVVSSSTLEANESSRALAAGNKVATKSREEEMPRMAIDLADFDFIP